MVIWQTNPFLTSIVAYFLLREPILPLETLAMLICFSAVVVIAT